MKEKFTIMLPVSRNNIPLSNQCIEHLLNNCELNIVVVDEHGTDNDYIKDKRISFIHNNIDNRPPLVKIWNQCIKECPTEYVIIASWRQRPESNHFKLIEEKLNDGYGFVCFDSLHFFAFSKQLTTIVGFFDEGFIKGQFEDTDWFNRMRANDIAVYAGDIPEQRVINGVYVYSTWLDNESINERYYNSKWTEDRPNGTIIQKKEEVNYNDRNLFSGVYANKPYKKWNESILSHNLTSYFKIYNKYARAI